MDSWEGSHDDGEWIRPGQAGRSGSRREPRPPDWDADAYDDADPGHGDQGGAHHDRTAPNDDRVRPTARDEYVRAVPREEAPPARWQAGYQDHFEDERVRDPSSQGRGTATHVQPPYGQATHDTYDGYGYGDDYQHGQTYAEPGYTDATRHGGASSPFVTGWLPLWPTVGIALAAIILAFIIGRVTAGGGGGSVRASTTVTTVATTTTTSATALTATVARGETLSAIASRYGVTATALATYNNITDPSRIFVGQVLNIPPKTP